jgi:hypothetical protein
MTLHASFLPHGKLREVLKLNYLPLVKPHELARVELVLEFLETLKKKMLYQATNPSRVCWSILVYLVHLAL